MTIRFRSAALLAASIASLTVLAAACSSRVPPATAPAPAAPVASLTWEALRSAEYRVELPASGRARLVDGVYEEPAAPDSASEISVALGPWHAFGDLDGDGVNEAAVVLIESGGGSGSFFDLAVVRTSPHGPEHVASAFLGDRVRIEKFAIEGRVIVIRLKAHRAGDPLCCPSAETTLRYALDGHALLRVGAATGPRS